MADAQKKRRGPKLIGKEKRKRFNLSLDPTVVESGQKRAEIEGVSFSMWVERLIRSAIRDKQGGNDE